jgi:hypothetical protein
MDENIKQVEQCKHQIDWYMRRIEIAMEGGDLVVQSKSQCDGCEYRPDCEDICKKEEINCEGCCSECEYLETHDKCPKWNKKGDQ